MNARSWIEYFEGRAARAVAVDWGEPVVVGNDGSRRALARSLAVFQLGETGNGRRLRCYVRDLVAAGTVSPDYERAVHLFIAEENRHAALLARMVERLGGELVQRNWTNTVFRAVRGIFSASFEIQILLTAELVAEAYYGLLHRHLDDPVLKACCGEILRDEVGHITFHADFFRARLQSTLPVYGDLWRFQFQAILAATRAAVWVDHGGALASLGVTRAAFDRATSRACRSFFQKIEGRTWRETEPATRRVSAPRA